MSIVRSGSKFRDTGFRAILPMLSLTGYPPPSLIGRRGGKQTDLEHVWILSKHGNGVVVQVKLLEHTPLVPFPNCSVLLQLMRVINLIIPSWKRRYDTYQIEIMSMQPLQSSCMAFWLAGGVTLDSQPLVTMWCS